MRYVLLVSVWTWSAIGTPAAWGPPAQQQPHPAAVVVVEDQPAAADVPEEPQPTYACVTESCPDCPKPGRHRRHHDCKSGHTCEKLLKWLCYVPAKTPCGKTPQTCCMPPMYLYFTCCKPCGTTMKPPAGCVPTNGPATKTAGCRTCGK